MAVTATTVAAATTMLAAVAAVFLTFVLCFYVFLCAKRYRGGAPPAGSGVAAWLRFLMWGDGGARSGADGAAAAAWCYDGGLDDKSMAKLPRREVGKGESLDCAVCITELAAGETARVLPRCGHAFHVDCVDMWLKSHSTCPLCRCPAVDEPPAAPPAVTTPEADPESPNFPTNVLFFGSSQDDVSTGRAQQNQSPPTLATATAAPSAQSQEEEEEAAARVLGLRRLLGCGGASPPPHHHHQQGDIEMGLAAGETRGR
ncbi:hypothetical protein EJB05_11215, partial [Eragrostis curvula]